MIGGRSGNRGKCAQTCRLPYELLEEDKKIDSGYLLSTRDLCALEYLPELIKSGVKCFKIEGRMKSPEYVATVTKIYRKYIDKILNNETYIIDDKDKKDLMQVFNRGGFSHGHLSDNSNTKLVFKEKQNNMGIYLGQIYEYNKNKGLVTVKLEDCVNIGDCVCFENENTKYTISELMEKNINIKQGLINKFVTFGRMKGNINVGDKIYKIESKTLTTQSLESFSKEFIKLSLECNISILKNKPIHIKINCFDYNISTEFIYDYILLIAENKPISEDKIILQFSKTSDTPFEFSKFKIDLEDGLFLPVSVINDIRRKSLENIENSIISTFKRKSNAIYELNCRWFSS